MMDDLEEAVLSIDNSIVERLLNKEEIDVISKIMERVIFSNLPQGEVLITMLRECYREGKKNEELNSQGNRTS